MSNSHDRSNWAQLFRIAFAHIRQANSKQFIIDHWTFGGGTALMLQIGHRESHDVDIFDIAAAGKQHEDAIVAELGNYRDEVTQALVAINKLNTDFVSGAIAQLAIREEYMRMAPTALERTKTILLRASSVRS